MSVMASQITGVWIVYLTVQAHIKGNIKAPSHWPLWGEFTCDQSIPRTKGQQHGKCFHLMTSSRAIVLQPQCVSFPWWHHQMETFSTLLAICAENSPGTFPVNSPHKGQWHGALMFSLICARINGWVNNGEAGDLRPHQAHYDVTVMPMLEQKYFKVTRSITWLLMSSQWTGTSAAIMLSM